MVSSLKLTFKDVAIRQFYYLCVFLILSFENRRKKVKCVRHTSFIYFYLSRNIGIIYSSIYDLRTITCVYTNKNLKKSPIDDTLRTTHY